MTRPQPSEDPHPDLAIMGRVGAPYAVRGWLKIQTYTEYLDSLADYPVWHLGRQGRWQAYTLLESKVHGRSLLAHLEGIDDRNAAEALVGMDIAVPREEMPATDEDEYYWDDLIGLAVVNPAGVSLGRVEGLLETGAHDILRVQGEKEHLIPFVEAIVLRVDLEGGEILVDWGADY